MIEFIDKTSEQDGTDINRFAMMAVQGFDNQTITYSQGKQIITNSLGQTLTSYIDGNSVIGIFVGEKTIKKTTTFNDNGTVTEVLS